MRSVRRRHFTALIPSHSLFLLPFCKCQLALSLALGNSFSSSHSLTQQHLARWGIWEGEEAAARAKFLPSAQHCTASPFSTIFTYLPLDRERTRVPPFSPSRAARYLPNISLTYVVSPRHVRIYRGIW